ncbi:MAG: HDOD domain-containing protein, partial [Thermoanaerobaculia bacterium]
PFETATLLTTLSREGHLQALGAWPAVEELTSVAGDSPLPVAPDLPGRIYWILRQSGKNLDQIAEVISQEPTLAAKALRHFSTARIEPIRGDLSVAQIIEGLGELRARAFVIPELIRGVFFTEKDFFWKGCRKHSVFCAHLCRELADLTGYPRPQEAYLAGLLHNLGVYVLIGVNPARYRLILGEARRTGADLCTLEKDAFGMSHVKVGMAFAQRWHFPTPIAEAVWLHHQGQDGTASPLVDLVALANWVAAQRQVSPEYCSPIGNQIDGALERFKLKRKQLINWAEGSARVTQAIV